jgi:hypothetical protein
VANEFDKRIMCECMSSIYKRKLKCGEVWIASVCLKDGTWRKRNTGIAVHEDHSKLIAKTWAKVVQSKLDAGIDPINQGKNNDTELFRRMTQDYMNERGAEWARATAVSRADTFRKFSNTVGDKGTRAIGREDGSAFNDWLLANLGQHSVNIHLRNLGAFFNWAKDVLPGWTPPAVREVKAPGAAHVGHLTMNEVVCVLTARQR